MRFIMLGTLLYRMSQKNEPLFVMYFRSDYKLKIIETPYTVSKYILCSTLLHNMYKLGCKLSKYCRIKKDVSKNLVSGNLCE